MHPRKLKNLISKIQLGTFVNKCGVCRQSIKWITCNKHSNKQKLQIDQFKIDTIR